MKKQYIKPAIDMELAMVVEDAILTKSLSVNKYALDEEEEWD